MKGRAPGDLESLTNILVDLAKDPTAVLDLANGHAVRAKYDAETETARSLGIFGSPTFVIGSEIFWGDDRLEIRIDGETVQAIITASYGPEIKLDDGQYKSPIIAAL